MNDKPKIVLITGFWKENSRSVYQNALKLVNILDPLSCGISWIVTNQSFINDFNRELSMIVIKTKYVENSFVASAFYNLRQQIMIMFSIMGLIKASKCDVLVFAFGSDMLLLPVVLSRILGKKVILRSDGRPSYILRMYSQKPNKVKQLLFRMVESLNYCLVTKLVPECTYMVNLYDLQKYSTKIMPGNLYVDTREFSVAINSNERKYEIGYIGRFENEKGVLEFVRSLCLMQTSSEFHALMVGDGKLKEKVLEMLPTMNIRVDVVNWVEQKELPRYLNDVKMLVVPSSKEGLPNIVLEAMACRTIVVATSVGGLPDVIRDGVTGFVLDDNSPECIARTVNKALASPNLDRIINNAQELIDKEYIYSAALKRFENILDDL